VPRVAIDAAQAGIGLELGAILDMAQQAQAILRLRHGIERRFALPFASFSCRCALSGSITASSSTVAAVA
jgi:hypothetical protein